jgi:hypothetical protein
VVDILVVVDKDLLVLDKVLVEVDILAVEDLEVQKNEHLSLNVLLHKSHLQLGLTLKANG